MEYLDMATKTLKLDPASHEELIVALDNYSYDQLNAIWTAAGDKLSTKKAEARDQLRAEFLEKAAAHGFSFEEIMEAKRGSRSTKGSPVEAKYRNPKTGETYSGRGMMPRWMKEMVDAGAKKEDFLIKK